MVSLLEGKLENIHTGPIWDFDTPAQSNIKGESVWIPMTSRSIYTYSF